MKKSGPKRYCPATATATALTVRVQHTTVSFHSVHADTGK
jgi:hypothetical protein